METIAKYVKKNKKEIFYVGLITLFAIIFRAIAFYCRNGVWIDELFSIYFIRQDNILQTLTTLWNEDVHMPAYFLLTKILGNIFGDTTFVYRLIGTVFSTLSVPLGFFIGKKLFNKPTGYLFAILLAISVFFTYYSIEIRFYGILVLFSIISTYFQAIFLKTNKSSLGLITSSLLVIYTFNLGIIFVFCQFLVGLIYLTITKKELTKYIKNGVFTAILSIPAIIFLLKTSTIYSNSLFSFVKEVFYFDLSFVYSLSLAYFSNLFFTLTNNATWDYNLATMFNARYIIFGIIPIIISLYGIIKSLKTKNSNLLIILLPSVIFLLIEITLASMGKMGIIPRHTIISYPAIILAVAYGLTLDIKIINKILIVLLILLQLIGIWGVKNTALTTKFGIFEKINNDIKELNLTSKDYIFVAEMGFIVQKFYDTDAKFVDFNADKICFYGDKKSMPKLFDQNTTKTINRENKSEILKPYLRTDKPLTSFREFINKDYFNHLKKDTRFCILITNPKAKLQNPTRINDEMYKYELYRILVNKINLEILDEATKKLELETVINPENTEYLIFVYKTKALQNN